MLTGMFVPVPSKNVQPLLMPEESQKTRQVQVSFKPVLAAKLEELSRLFPEKSDAAIVRDAFLLAYPLMKGAGGIHSVADAARAIVADDIQEGQAVLDGSSTPEFVPMELVGEVAAGKPIDYEIEKEIIPLPKDPYGRYKDRGGKLVRVRGDSMKEAGISDGGLIVFRPQKTAENGQIVIADLKGDGTVLKKFHAEKGMVVLSSMNPEYAPILKKANEIQIHGLYLDSVTFDA